MLCCARCFNDPYLCDESVPARAGETGTCPQCDSPNVRLVEAVALKEEFEVVAGIYEPSDDGRPLIDWFQEDWALFDPDWIDLSKATLLLAEILDDTELIRRKLVPTDASSTQMLAQWHSVRAELKHENRFFPKTVYDTDGEIVFDLDRIEQLLPHVQTSVSDLPKSWHRARIQEESAPYKAEKMGAPPKDRATHGRANPAGIPYLYLASDAQTAVSEIRPHPGEVACVAEFSVKDNLSLADLREPRRSVSPFSLSSESEVAKMRGDVSFLEYFGEELTRPVIPQAAAIDYIPSQFLCEFIKNCGYDGVTYRSSVGPGINIALFDPTSATIGDIVSLNVNSVTVELGGAPT